MQKYLLNKVVYVILILLGVSILTFSLGRLAPGDPVQAIIAGIDEPITEEIVQEARAKFGLDKSISKQYIMWLKNVIKGDFGTSIKTGKPVLEEITTRMGPTIELTICSTIVMLLISFPIGILSAIYKDKMPDIVIRFFNIINISLPTFCVGIIFIILFGVKLKILPVMGRDGFRSIILPSLTMGISMSGGLIRLIRNEMLNYIENDCVYASTVFGVKRSKNIINNVVRNVMVVIVTNIGIYIGGLLGGSTIIESLFGWPGMGGYIIQAINTRDYAVIQAYAMLMAIIYIIINIFVDLSYYCLDPRIRSSECEE